MNKVQKFSVVSVIILGLLLAIGLSSCGASTSSAGANEGDNYVTFTKTLPSGKIVECVGWRYSGAQGEGAALECFPK